jgi:3-hydroxybutyryl-CoA dehydrogenase
MFDKKEITTVAVLGAGTMGANIALNLAAHGVAVWLTDVRTEQLEKAREGIEANARHLHADGLLPDEVERVLARIARPTTLDDALVGAELVIEAVPENLQLKLRVFGELERKCGPEVIFASNTSSFVPSKLAVGLVDPATAERLVVMHYWNPAHLVPLVEVVPHARTRADVLEQVKALLDRCAKQSVILRKELPGFIGNRLAFALQREAMSLVASGVAAPEDIDTVARAGFGRRIPVTGIFGTADLGGLDVYLAVCQSIFPDLCRDAAAPPALQRLVQQGRLGMKTGDGWSAYTEAEIAEIQERLTTELVRHARNDQEAARRARR